MNRISFVRFDERSGELSSLAFIREKQSATRILNVETVGAEIVLKDGFQIPLVVHIRSLSVAQDQSQGQGNNALNRHGVQDILYAMDRTDLWQIEKSVPLDTSEE